MAHLSIDESHDEHIEIFSLSFHFFVQLVLIKYTDYIILKKKERKNNNILL